MTLCLSHQHVVPSDRPSLSYIIHPPFLITQIVELLWFGHMHPLPLQSSALFGHTKVHIQRLLCGQARYQDPNSPRHS